MPHNRGKSAIARSRRAKAPTGRRRRKAPDVTLPVQPTPRGRRRTRLPVRIS